MKSRRHQKLRKNPFVRLFRMIYRALKVIFQPKRKRIALAEFRARKELEARTALDALNARKELEQRIALEALNAQKAADNLLKEQFLTVGELLERVKWKKDSETETVFHVDSVLPEYGVSLN